MPTRLVLATFLVAVPATAFAQGGPHDNIDALIEQQAKANKIPASFVHRVVKRESNYNPRAKGGSALGLMQIKHATARGMGYRGDAAGLFDPATNLKYGIAYLATAYRLAKGDLDQAYRYYNRGFYYAAKRLGIDTSITVPDDTPAVPAPQPIQTASSSNDFSKLFGLSSGGAQARSPSTASQGVTGTTALAYAGGSAATGPIEVPLPPRRPGALGGEPSQVPGSVAAQATATPVAAETVSPSAERPVAVAQADVFEVPLPPRRPSTTVLAATFRPATRTSRPVSTQTLEADAGPSQP